MHLLDGLWQALEIDTAVRKVLGPRRFTTNVERVLFALVANRAIDPMSKLSAAEWASADVVIDGLESMDEDQAHRAMDLLIEADAQAEVQEAVFFAVANLLNLSVDTAQAKIKTKLREIERQRRHLTERLNETTEGLSDSARLIEACLKLLKTLRSCTDAAMTSSGACSTRRSSTPATSTASRSPTTN